KIVIPAKFSTAYDFSEGMATVVTAQGKYVLINKEGKVVFAPENPSALAFAGKSSEGLLAFSTNRKWGYVDRAGELVIPPQFDAAQPFSGGLAAVRIGHKEGYINKTGAFVISPQFDMAGGFSEGLAPVEVGVYWGYVDQTGKVTIEPQFISAEKFSRGLAMVQTKEDTWCYIDKTGKPIWQSSK
ncbi:MAG: WG repeat-containing protein, partial [Candidatus Omnitrophica bacterium]|nr:WG repeat-containing protein [Candidatus Omnitrophota bacterium]